MLKVRLSVFSRIVSEVLDDLPERFHPFLENVAVQVAEEPSPEQLGDGGSSDADELLGLYEGYSLLERGAAHVGLPDRIWIFRGPLLRVSDSIDELRDEIRKTVIHELGHHMGLSDDEMIY